MATATPTPNLEVVEASWEEAERRVAGEQARRNRRLVIILSAIGLGMLGFAFLNVPLFGMLCAKLGFGQSPNSASVAGAGEKTDRTVQVLFMGNVMGKLPVTFRSQHNRMTVTLGEMAMNDYHFVNVTDRDVYIMPVHSIRPTAAASEDMFHLAECFCFDPMKLNPNQSLTVPVVFQLSPQLDSSVTVVTMNYTLFEIDEQRYHEALAERKEEKDGK